jgi:hypothetical protein
VPVLTPSAAEQLERDAATLAPSAIAVYLQEQLGQRMAAHLAGLADTRQIGRYAREDGPSPSPLTQRRLREGYKTVRMIVDAFDADTAKAWLFGTNTRLDDEAPIEVLGEATETAQFAGVVRAARQFASFG